MSNLLQGVLRNQSALPAEGLAAKLQDIRLSNGQPTPSSPSIVVDDLRESRTPSPENSSDDELVGVQSVAGTPTAGSRSGSRPGSRGHSPTRIGAANRRVPGPKYLGLSSGEKDQKSPASTKKDPLKALPTEIGQRIFGLLGTYQLARCSRVSKKWNRSQTLNYVWFQLYRKENFHDDSLPPGKWSRRESKQNWRVVYLENRRKTDIETNRSPNYFSLADATYTASSKGGSGYQTPREIREEKWKAEAEETKPGKVEMREMYKDLGGRKSKAKAKYSAGTNSRDRGGWADES
ncbi:hypothetical protein FRB94_014181 [Tulasnella sp. JGI-2019a]|nr:hypothetical protein FRB94_014181 [Tulasnella sp. JGI-2019a]